MELAQQNLDGNLASQLGRPLLTLLESLDSETDPVTVSSMPSRAAEAVRQLGISIQGEIAKRTASAPTVSPSGGQQPPTAETASSRPESTSQPVKQVRKVKPQDVALVTVIHDVKEWDALRDKLDERVRELIRQGYDVDLG